MTTEIAALVRQMRDALVEAWPIIPRGYRLDRAKTAVSAADQWLAQQRGPLTDEQRKWAVLGPLIERHEIWISTPSNRVHRNGGPNAGWGPAGCWGGTAWKHGLDYRPVSHSKETALEVLEELAAKLSAGIDQPTVEDKPC